VPVRCAVPHLWDQRFKSAEMSAHSKSCPPVPRLREIKLLLVSSCQGTYGGIEAFVLAVAEAVQREPDFEVRVCFKKVKGFALHPNLATMLRHESFRFVDSAGSALAGAIKWADIVHLQYASPDVIALAKFFRKPIVLTIHNHMPCEWSLHRLLWRIGARFADARWYNSDFVWKTWEGNRKRRGSRKVPTVSKLSLQSRDWTPSDQRRGFVFVGRWIANKGIETLVDAYARADLDRVTWPLLLIGDGPLRPAIEARIETLGLSRDCGIRMAGFVDDATKVRCIKEGRWLVAPPNTNEDFGLTAIEARALGVPCIITRDGGLPEAAGDQALVCEPNDPTALANLLEQAARMSETEYAHRAQRTREQLKDELEPMDFYARSYRHILVQKPAV
jgi:glycosyltransferase involved in cell wall biosynthesis